jgi:tRNA(Leu) C34 or U34 (ribose-2'-O)-methylase TrmL
VFFVAALKEPGFSEEQNYLERRIYKQTIGAYAGRLLYVDDLSDVIAEHRGKMPLVFLTPDPRNAVDLWEFDHPEECLYVFGSCTENLERFIQEQDHRVTITTPNKTDMFGCGCLGTVLAYRYERRQQNTA